MSPAERLNRQAVHAGMVFVAALLALWAAFGLGVSLGARSTVGSLAEAMALNEAHRRQVMDAYLARSCAVWLTNPMWGPIAPRSPRP